MTGSRAMFGFEIGFGFWGFTLLIGRRLSDGRYVENTGTLNNLNKINTAVRSC